MFSPRNYLNGTEFVSTSLPLLTRMASETAVARLIFEFLFAEALTLFSVKRYTEVIILLLLCFPICRTAKRQSSNDEFL